jgi:hypothetical protein
MTAQPQSLDAIEAASATASELRKFFGSFVTGVTIMTTRLAGRL